MPNALCKGLKKTVTRPVKISATMDGNKANVRRSRLAFKVGTTKITNRISNGARQKFL